MAAAPVFEQVAPALYALSSRGDPGLSGWWAGFRAGPDAGLGAAATPAEAWAAGGVYLFLGATPDELDPFDAALAALLGKLPPDVRFLWLEDPHLPPGAWRFQLLRAEGGVVTRQAIIGTDPYGVRVEAGARLAPADAEALGHGIVVPFSFQGPAGTWGTPAGTAWLPLAGPLAGAFVATVPVPADGEVDGMERLGVALRYALPGAPDPADEAVTVVEMPVLRQGAADVTLQLAFDPLNLLDPSRSRLVFGAGTGALEASFATALGYPTTLTPLAAPAAPLRGARLVFCRYPRFTTVGAADAAFGVYLAPDGAFSVTVDVPPGGSREPGALANRLTLGASGVEYAGLRAETGAVAHFDAGRPAFAPNAREGGARVDAPAPLTALGTTAWLTLFPPPGRGGALTYYAQPPRAPFYAGVPALPDGILGFLELPASHLAADPFPAAGYRGMDPALADAALLLENAALTPVRRARVGTLPPGPVVPGEAFAVTPQGLVAGTTRDGPRLVEIVLGNLPKMAAPRLALPIAGTDFLKALQSNDVFFVAANPQVLAAASPVQSLRADLDGWVFDLEPAGWRTRGGEATHDSPTILIFKFGRRSLAEMVADTAAWGWPEAAAWEDGDLADTQSVIRQLFDDAAAAAPGTPYRAFHTNVVSNPAWNGVLFLNAPVGLDDLPDALQFLAAGIDPAKFYAHHVGFPVTPFDVADGVITLGQTAVFGLIDYRDPGHLFLTDVPFAFKTLSLTAVFANAALAGFAAQVELLMNVLFSDSLTREDPDHGNNLLLNGSLQLQNGQPAYVFTLEGTNRYRLAHSALESVEVLAVQLQGSVSADQTVTADFVLGGNLRFVELEDFDLFSYGAQRYTPEGKTPVDGRLRFGSLLVRMSFPLATPSAQTYVAYEGERMTFDLANSRVRPRSLANDFPLRVSGCLAVESGQTPEALGYASVLAPLDQQPLSPPWYALTFDLPLGTLGALAGGAGLSLTVLAAWSPGNRVYLGLRFPTGDPLNAVLPVQGVVKLGFRSLQFTASDADDPALTRTHILRMHRFGISVFGLGFPPGNADILLFGGRDGTGKKMLGWYGAYVADSVAKTSGVPGGTPGGTPGGMPGGEPPPPPVWPPVEEPDAPPPDKAGKGMVAAAAEAAAGGGAGGVASVATRREARSLLSGRRGIFQERPS